jgi:D-alanyl-D-alanine dipeptidase
MNTNTLPTGFVLLKEHLPELLIDLKYTGNDNLIGRRVEGYFNDSSAIITQPAADALARVVRHLHLPENKRLYGLSAPTLLILDTYRPQMACEDFWQWAQSDCEKTQKDYYPNILKTDLFPLGYVARKSTHSRGSTVDLTIVDQVAGSIVPLDMGTPFDFMDILSHPGNKTVSEQAYANRQFLRNIMETEGFAGINTEWWHFTLKNEPFPDTYFNFPLINFEA